MTHTRIALTLILAAPLVRAAEPTSGPVNPWARGTWTVQAEGSYTAPIRYSTSDRTTGSIGVGYYLFDNHAITLLGRGFHIDDEGGHAVDGADVSFMGRSHLFTRGGFSLYIDGGGGYAWGNHAFPAGGTTYNFTARVGPGMTVQVADSTYLTAGARYFHNSNAQAHGHEKNPGYDGVEYYVGVLVLLR